MEEIFIVGVGMTRFGKHLDRSVKSLVAEAVGGALSDANAQQADVGAAVHLPLVSSASKIIYGQDCLAELVADIGVTDILLAIPSASRQRRREIIESLRHLPLHVRTLPGMADLASGRVGLSDVRELDIEDLLGREPC